MKTKLVIILMFAAFVWMRSSLPGLAYAGDVIIIANKDVPSSSLTSDEIKNIFLAKKTQWDNGQKINFVTLKESQTHDDFLKKHLQRSPSQFQRYFRTLVFTGKGQAPLAFDSEAALVNFVASTNGAIGYVSSETNTDSTKIINVN